MAQKPAHTKPAPAEGFAAGDALAATVAAAWVVVMGLFFWMVWPDAPSDDGFAMGRLALAIVAVLVPAGLILVASAAARTARDLRLQLFQMQAGIDRIAGAQAAMAQTKTTQPATAPIQPTPAVVQPQSTAEQDAPPADAAPVSGFSSRREVSRLIVPHAAPQMPADQPALALETPPEQATPPIARPDLIKALHFPNDENDAAGFAALRRALRDRGARKLVQASQDVLVLLSQDGIYMDDLHPAPTGADLWRRFAKGERGKAVDLLGGIKEQHDLSAISIRMREDTIFRDSVHHFLRCFDQFLVTFEENATDTDLLELAETRTSRAFMLLGRATGTFD